ncbi:MAG: hypothetical protein U0271_43900 [Polyangiaceae bacterium]
MRLSVWLSLALVTLGCAKSPPREAEGEVATTSAKTNGSAPATSTVASVAEPTCAEPPARCAIELTSDEARRLDADIDAVYKLVIDSSFADASALATLARLGLRRDNQVSDREGATDRDRATKNALRALAVDGTLTSARFTHALALSATFARSTASRASVSRAVALRLVAVRLGAIGSPPRVAAAARTLEGYLTLASGDAERASSLFHAATELDATLASAWVGAGDAARASKRFDVARDAYATAKKLAPNDRAIDSRIADAAQGRALPLPARSVTALDDEALGESPVAGAPPKIPACTKAEAKESDAAAFCTGLADLAQAKDVAARVRAATAIASAFSTLRGACSSKSKACGAFAGDGLAAAGRAFLAGGQTAKGIAVFKMALAPELPGGNQRMPHIALEIADAYYALGVLDVAADFYERAATEAPKDASSGLALARATAVRVTLGQEVQAVRAVARLADNDEVPAARRAAWLLTVAALERASQGVEGAKAILAGREALLASAGREADAAAVLDPARTETAPLGGCEATLDCAISRLANERF